MIHLQNGDLSIVDQPKLKLMNILTNLDRFFCTKKRKRVKNKRTNHFECELLF